VSRYVSRRVLAMIPVIIIVSIMVFSMVHLSPGDPVMLLIPPEEASNEETIELMRRRLGLDRPVVIQYLDWGWNALQGDLGRSIRTRQEVTEAIIERLPVTLQLSLFSTVLSLVVAIPLGIISALKRNSWFDSAATFTGLMGISLPNMFVGIALIFIFALKLGWLPPSGYVSVFDDPVAGFKSLLLPSITLGTALMASVMRMMRSTLLETLRREYITTARAKGLAPKVVISRHALRNALIPVTTIVGLQIAGLLGGAFIIEYIFALPGVGKLAIDSIYARDFPVVQGVVLFFTITFLGINLLVDLGYAFLDPRIRYS